MNRGFLDQGTTIAAPLITEPVRADLVLGSVVLLVLTALVSIVVHRFRTQNTQMKSTRAAQASSSTAVESTMTRPVLAVILVGTVLILAAASLTFDDAGVRNLLVGGVVSLSSAAAAFYFAASGATEARRDLLTATGATAEVPNLVGKTPAEAQKIMSGHSLKMVLPDPPPDPALVVDTQSPGAGMTVRSGQMVTVTFK